MPIPAIAWTILSLLLGFLEGPARSALSSGIQSFYKHAKESPRQSDDILAALLVALLKVDVSGVVIEPKPDTNTVPVPPEVLNQIISTVVTVSTGNPWNPPGNELGGA